MYCELIASTFLAWCRAAVWHAGDLRALVPLWSKSGCASSQAIMINNLILYLHYFGYTKSNTMVKNQLIG